VKGWEVVLGCLMLSNPLSQRSGAKTGGHERRVVVMSKREKESLEKLGHKASVKRQRGNHQGAV